MNRFKSVFAANLVSTIAHLVNEHIPERVYIVSECSDPYNPYSEAILGFGDRQVAQRVFEDAVKTSGFKLSRGSRTKGYAWKSWPERSICISIREINRRQFQDLLLNPGVSDLLRRAVETVTAEE